MSPLAQGGPNAPVEPPVVSGQALMGISAADYTAAAVAEGAPFKIIAVAMQKNPFAIASLPKNPVKVPKDLEGKKIGMATANTPVLQALCTINEVDIDKITDRADPVRRGAAGQWRGRLPAVLADRPADRDDDEGHRQRHHAARRLSATTSTARPTSCSRIR